jgi:hypothetical protein
LLDAFSAFRLLKTSVYVTPARFRFRPEPGPARRLRPQNHPQRRILNADKKCLRAVVRHPLGRLNYAFDKKNSEKIKNWLGSTTVTNARVLIADF